MGRPPLSEHVMKNVFFDTCVYHLPGIELLAKVIPVDNILFASEMVGAVKGIDPTTGHHYDDTKRYVDQLKGLSEQDRYKVFEGQRAARLPAAGQTAEETEGATMSASMRILDIPKRPDPRLGRGAGQDGHAAPLRQHGAPLRERAAASPDAQGGQARRPGVHGEDRARATTCSCTGRSTPAKPGDVIVVDAGGFGDHAIIGELMMSRARQRGVAGIVIWGAIRDSAEIGAGDYPVFACAVTHRGPYKNGPGEINVPISIAGIAVMPGDIIVGDADGLVAVPQEQAERILASAKAILEKETAAMKQIMAGTVDRGWVEKALREKGYKV
jgi:hypothetical protein